MGSVLQRLYRTKLALLATVLTATGLVVLLVSQLFEWPGWLPVADVGSALFTSGLIVVALEYLDAQDVEQRTTDLLRQVLRQEAPAIRDAVIEGFAFEPDDVARVASSATVDRIVENCLTRQLGDRGLATDVYADLRAQVLRSSARHFDVHVSVTLTPWGQGPAAGAGSMFVATVRWEYLARPVAPVFEFSCVSDYGDFRRLSREPTSAGVWYFAPPSSGGPDASSREAFDLLHFSLDGIPCPVQRTSHTGGQVFTITTGEQATSGGQGQVSYTYRVLVKQHGHLLFLDFVKPSKGVHVDLWYSDCDIGYIDVLDFIAGAKLAHIHRSPKGVPAHVTVSFEGWVFPASSVAFVWTLGREIAPVL